MNVRIPTLAENERTRRDHAERYATDEYARVQALRHIDPPAVYQPPQRRDTDRPTQWEMVHADLAAMCAQVSETRVSVYFIIAALAVFAIKHFWGIV